MHVDRTVGAKRDNAIGKLQGIQVSAIVQIDEACDRGAVRAAHLNGGIRRVLDSDAGSGKMPIGDGKSGAGRVADVMRVRSAQHASGITGRSADIAIERKRAGRKQGLFQGECGGDVARAAKASGLSAGDEGNAGLYRELIPATLTLVVRDYDQRAAVTAVLIFF